MAVYEWELVGAAPTDGSDQFTGGGGWYCPFAYNPTTKAFRAMLDGNTEVYVSDDGLDSSTVFATAGAMGKVYRDMSTTYDGTDTWFFAVASDQYIYYMKEGTNSLILDYTGAASDDFYGALLAYDASTTRWGASHLRLAAGWISGSATFGIIKIIAGVQTLVRNTGAIRIGRIRDNGSIFVAMPSGTETATYYTSVDGTTWTERTLPATARDNRNFFDVFNGVFYYISGRTGSSMNFHTSSDGINWVTKALPVSGYAMQIAVDGAGKIVLTTYQNLFYISEDSGTSWTQVLRGATVNADVVPILWDGAYFKIIAQEGGTATRNVYRLVDATPPETIWANVVGCQIS
jgi:hypothetical protein